MNIVRIALGATAAPIAACAGIYAVVGSMCAKAFGSRPDKDRPHYTYMYDHYAPRYPRREAVFPGTEGALHGFLYGEENDKALIVVCHGIGAFHEDYLSTIIWFVDHGYRVFAPDFTGSGYSGGKGTNGLPQSAIDLDRVLSYIEADPELNRLPKVLFGHSWGGYAVGAGLNFDHDVKAAVTVAGFNDPIHQLGVIFEGMFGKVGKIAYPFLRLWHRQRFGKNGLLTAVDGINKAGIPVLIVQGMEDRLNAPDGTSIYAARAGITNPKVRYHLITKLHCADHMSPFFIDEANEHLCHMVEVLENIGKKYTEPEKSEKEREYYDSLNKDLCSRPNEDFFTVVDEFYTDSLTKEG